MATSPVRKKARLVGEEYPHSEDGVDKDRNYEEFLMEKMNLVVMEDVKEEAQDSDTNENGGVNVRWSGGTCFEFSNTPKMRKSSLVKENSELSRSSRRFKSKDSMKIQNVNVRAGNSNVLPRGFGVPQEFSSHMDANYRAFLNFAEINGDQMTYLDRNGTQYIYEEDRQSSLDSERTLLDRDRRDEHHLSIVKTKAANKRTDRRGAMNKRISCPESYVDTSSDSDLHALESNQDDGYFASLVKKKIPNERVRKTMSSRAHRHVNRNTPTEYIDVPAKKSSVIKKSKDPLSTVSDDEYKAFESQVEVDGRSLILTTCGGGRKIYEDAETTSNAEMNAIDIDPVYSLYAMDSDSEQHNGFREGIMKELERPYNQAEYLKLLEDACSRGPSDHEIDLYNEMNSIQLPREYGRSYLGVYKDLSEKIDKANENREKTLNLLRGLFYWLKNQSLDGSFIPWKDKLCLLALPQPKEK